MGLLDFVEQQDRMRLLVNGIGQQATLVITDIARRRTDQAADRMPFHIFAHVEPLERNAHDRGKLARDFRLANTGWPGEQVGSNRLFGIAQASPRQFDRG